MAGCVEETVPEEVEQRYIAFIETTKTSWRLAVGEYLHYENPNSANAARFVEDYEIKQWKKLSNELWVVCCKITSVSVPTGEDCYHFVGLIDGKYYVMVNPLHVPSDLKEGLDLTQYMPTGDHVA